MRRRASSSGVGRNPLYVQIADTLRRRIADGTYGPEEQLPTLDDLCEEFECSSTAVRGALDVLRTAGLIVGLQGKGTFVRRTRSRQFQIVDQFYRKRHTSSPLFAAISAAGAEPSLRHESGQTHASPAVADRLAIAVGDDVMRTHYVFYADDEPVMLSTSYEPLALTHGTPIEEPERSPTTGVVARFDLIGVHIDASELRVIARGPAPDEVSALRIPHGVPVMAIERTYLAKDKPIETTDIVVAGDNYMLTYVFPIPAK